MAATGLTERGFRVLRMNTYSTVHFLLNVEILKFGPNGHIVRPILFGYKSPLNDMVLSDAHLTMTLVLILQETVRNLDEAAIAAAAAAPVATFASPTAVRYLLFFSSSMPS